MNQGLRFKTAREFLQKSQGQMADIVGISQYTISKLESNKTDKPNYKYISYLINQGISESWLVDGFGDMVNNENKVLFSDAEWKERALKAEKEVSTLKDTISELRKKINVLYEHLITKDLKIEGLELGKVEASSIQMNADLPLLLVA